MIQSRATPARSRSGRHSRRCRSRTRRCDLRSQRHLQARRDNVDISRVAVRPDAYELAKIPELLPVASAPDSVTMPADCTVVFPPWPTPNVLEVIYAPPSTCRLPAVIAMFPALPPAPLVSELA